MSHWSDILSGIPQGSIFSAYSVCNLWTRPYSTTVETNTTLLLTLGLSLNNYKTLKLYINTA